jgi:hypothetical protein
LEKIPNTNKIDWSILSANPAAIHLIAAELETNPYSNKIDWNWLSGNPTIFKQSNGNLLIYH